MLPFLTVVLDVTWKHLIASCLLQDVILVIEVSTSVMLGCTAVSNAVDCVIFITILHGCAIAVAHALSLGRRAAFLRWWPIRTTTPGPPVGLSTPPASGETKNSHCPPLRHSEPVKPCLVGMSPIPMFTTLTHETKFLKTAMSEWTQCWRRNCSLLLLIHVCSMSLILYHNESADHLEESWSQWRPKFITQSAVVVVVLVLGSMTKSMADNSSMMLKKLWCVCTLNRHLSIVATSPLSLHAQTRIQIPLIILHLLPPAPPPSRPPFHTRNSSTSSH